MTNQIRLMLFFAGILIGGLFNGLIYAKYKLNSVENEYAAYRTNMESEMSDLESAFNNAMLRARNATHVQRELECLAKNIYFEASTESREGQMAVAMVTRNRVVSNRYPKTYCAVVYQGCQFSWTCQKNKRIPANDRRYNSAKRIAEEVLIMGKVSGIIDSSVMFYHADYVNPNWAQQKEMVVKIGAHIFYR